uniref:uncharacterized protein LOC101309339 isoform X2 n=1 Tax=Fragaria vesca subsp. vesca TaxID=101020 RepID=UPI0005C82980|nr:PREDICTED: uncharacterized protein LOC101309339 isoform X2 [Fragaria vesca subsp. vesca]
MVISSSNRINAAETSCTGLDVSLSCYLLSSDFLLQIEKYIFHILAAAELYNRLSKQKAFAKMCLVDLEKHLEESVLSKLGNNYQSIFQQSMISEENDMVAKLQLDMFVVCKTNHYLGHIQPEDNEDEPSDNRANQRPLEEPFEMEPDVLCFVRYKAVKRFVEEGRIDLF